LANFADHHAVNAAKLLRRLALIIAAGIAPAVALFSRNTAAVALPLAAMVLGFAALVDPERSSPMARIGAALASGLAAPLLYLLGWFALSLAWTPFPGQALPRLAAPFSLIVIAALALAAVPDRLRAATLNVIPLGVFIAALIAAATATAAALQALPASFAVDPFIRQRGLIFLILLSFVGAGWLLSRRRRIEAAALLVVVAAALAVTREIEPVVAFGFGVLAFALAGMSPSAAAALAVALAVVTLAAPLLLPLIVAQLEPSLLGLTLPQATALERFGAGLWADPLKLVTGHGFDTFRHAQRAGLAPDILPRLPFLDLWYEAGLPGVLAMLVGTIGAARAARAAKAGIPAAGLAVLSAALAYHFFGMGWAQHWWTGTLCLSALMLACIARGPLRTARPQAAEAGRGGLVPLGSSS
jgi:hypothetical protein